VADASFTFENKELFQEILGARIVPSYTSHTADRLRTGLSITTSLSVTYAALMVIIVVLFLSSDDIHSSLRQDGFYNIIQRYCGFNSYFQTHPDINAHQGFIQLE
jgi:hypothetical protein